MDEKKKTIKPDVKPDPEAPKGRHPLPLEDLEPVSGGGSEWDDVPKSNENPYEDPINP